MQDRTSAARPLPIAREAPERPETAHYEGHGVPAPVVSTVNVLLVEDNPADARLVQEMLRFVHHTLFRLSAVDCLAAALARVSVSRPDLILLDLSLPDS